MTDPTAFDIASPKNKIKLMQKAIQHLQGDPDLGFVKLLLVATFIDGLVQSPKGRVGVPYKQYLETHFPEMCKQLGAEVFYEYFRNSSIHEFAPRPPFALGSTKSLGQAYVGRWKIENREWTLLNIDRLVADFLQHLGKLVKATNQA